MAARALPVLLLSAASSVAARRGGHPGAPANGTALRREHPGLERVKEQCGAITECYCIRQTPCGWCGTLGKGLVGADDGPYDAEHCLDWVAWADDCPTFHCSTGEYPELLWVLQSSWLPLLCFIMWLIVYCYREGLKVRHLEPPEMEALAAEVGGLMGSQNTDDSEGPSSAALSYARQQVQDFFSSKRTYQGFRKAMNCPKEERLQEGARRPYEVNLSDLSIAPGETIDTSRVGPHRLEATIRVGLQWRTALGASLSAAMFLMFVSAVYLAVLRNAARHLPKEEYLWLASVTHDLSALVAPLQKAVSMLLSFYVLNRIAWYWSVLMEGFVVQGRSHDLGMIGGVVPRDSEEAWQECYRLYRYVTLNFFFAYQPYTPGLKFVGFRPLVMCGLLDHEEVQVLKNCNKAPLTVTESWISNWIAENLTNEARQQAFQALRELRNSCSMLQGLLEQRAPVSFESLLYLVTYCLIVLVPFAPSNVDYNNRRAVMDGVHLATVMGDGIILAFYISLLHMLRHLQSPFDDMGAPHDALNPVAIMNSTERKLRDYLGAPDPHEVLNGNAS